MSEALGPFPASLMTRDTPPDPELLRSLGRLVRGLSLLFWSLPVALVVCAQSAVGDWFRQLDAFGVVPALILTALLLHSLNLLGSFQKSERPWMAALDRARILAVVNLGLSPFLYWSSRVPSHHFLAGATQALALTGLLFLISLNPLLSRLAAMLPDETLRLETRLFTSINRMVLLFVLALIAAYAVVTRIDPAWPSKFIGWLISVLPISDQAAPLVHFIAFGRQWILIFFVLLPLAMTMALIWKIKEVILASVFGAAR